MTQPRVRHDEGPSTINNSEPAPVSSSEPVSASPPFQRRQSAQDRLDNILETARRRSIALKSSQQQLQPLSPMSLPRAQRDSLNISEERSAEIESSADEHTAIIHRHSRQPQQDYQSTGHSGVRSRNNSANVRRVTPQRTSGDNGRVHDETWWERQLAKYGSIELENKASVARDHLALERTFLAWLRTSLAFASIGIAITQLFRLNAAATGTANPDDYRRLRQMGKPLGATFLGISIVVLFLGFHRYFESQHWIIKGKFPASRGSVALISAIAFALMVTSLAVVLIVGPSTYED